MKKHTKKEIKKYDFELEMQMNKPTTILWSVIKELKDIQEFYLSNLFDYIRYKKKANKHLIHQIDRLTTLLNALEKE